LKSQNYACLSHKLFSLRKVVKHSVTNLIEMYSKFGRCAILIISV